VGLYNIVPILGGEKFSDEHCLNYYNDSPIIKALVFEEAKFQAHLAKQGQYPSFLQCHT
jgi:hypothetical protein